MELRPSLFKNLGMAAGCALMAALSFNAWQGGVEYGWAFVLALGLGAVYFLAHHLPGACSIKLFPQGFEMTVFYDTKQYAWTDISAFTVRRNLFGVYVQFDHDKEDGTQETVRVNEAFGRSVVQFVNVMNEWRERAEVAGRKPPSRVWKSKDR